MKIHVSIKWIGCDVVTLTEQSERVCKTERMAPLNRYFPLSHIISHAMLSVRVHISMFIYGRISTPLKIDWIIILKGAKHGQWVLQCPNNSHESDSEWVESVVLQCSQLNQFLSFFLYILNQLHCSAVMHKLVLHAHHVCIDSQLSSEVSHLKHEVDTRSTANTQTVSADMHRQNEVGFCKGNLWSMIVTQLKLHQ